MPYYDPISLFVGWLAALLSLCIPLIIMFAGMTMDDLSILKVGCGLMALSNVIAVVMFFRNITYNS